MGASVARAGLRGGALGERRERLRRRKHLIGPRTTPDAIAEERRRIAAEVHDLVMQDLAFGLASARMLADDPALTERVGHVVEAGERALAGARELVAELLNQSRRPVVEAVLSSARAAARNVPVTFQVGGAGAGDQPDRPTFDTLVHVAREAVTNAIKHAEPSSIAVVLDHADEWRLRVEDDGRGFDPADGPRGFGLESMSRQAELLGGRMRVVSEIGSGTTVEVLLP